MNVKRIASRSRTRHSHISRAAFVSTAAAVLLLLAAANAAPVLAETLEEVQARIARDGLQWIAGDTRLARETPEQRQARHGLRVPASFVPPRSAALPQRRDFPERFDWRENGGVTPAKDQGQCGSCWAFASLGAIESQVLINDGWAPDFSEQQLVSCDYFNHGCNGGWHVSSWYYYEDFGTVLEECMPYTASNSTPCTQEQCDHYYVADEFDYIDDSVEGIKAELENGPVPCAMFAYDDLHYYVSGCYEHEHTTNDVNHGVLIVGWDDTMCGTGAWIVKNSWSEDFGLDGYFYIKYGSCLIGYGAAYIRVAPVPPVNLMYRRHRVEDMGDGLPDPGETCGLEVTVFNDGRLTATNVTATLTTNTPGITVTRAAAAFPSIAPRSEAASIAPHFEFVVSNEAQLGIQIEFSMTLTSDQGQSTVTLAQFMGGQDAIFFDDFETADDNGWSHNVITRLDDWERLTPSGEGDWDPPAAASGAFAWGNKLSGAGTYRNNMACYLQSPEIDCSGHHRVFLRFKRWLTVEEGVFDQAVILVNDQQVWSNPDVGHLLDREWQDVAVDISHIADGAAAVSVRFELYADEGLTFGGWTIDDVLLAGVIGGMEPSPTATEQPTATPTPRPSPTPSPTVPPSPTPTDTPGRAAISLILSKPNFTAGDRFLLQYQWDNPSETFAANELIVLDVGGSYWFWPSWTMEIDMRQRQLPARDAATEDILDFIWPQVSGSLSGIKFWAGMTDEALAVIDVEYVEWGYSE